MLRPCACVVIGLLAAALSWPVWSGSAEDAPLPPVEAAAAMTLPEGFRATLFAGEPDLVQPMAFTLDDRGRLWVVESDTYPNWITDGSAGRDRILIFEDTNGDGRFDNRTVFWDQGTNLSGIELGFGGVWLTATPNLMFLPDRNGDDVPDGPPIVLLDGWDLNARHNVFNGLTWGPDDWLYGCNGILSNSLVGKPGTPDDERTPLNCGVWRYHPTKHLFEVVAWGTTNPWGLDFDDFGQMFITNCVIKHLFHVVPGGHYERMYGQDLNSHVYGLMESCADHIHWGGGKWQDSRGGQGKHDKPGGGHAHAGAMIYLGDNWPDEFRGNLFTCNIHGARVNRDILERNQSGYVARHGQDFMLANDPWFRGLELKYGPDGGVYVTDWTDSGECHDFDHADKTNGRIYKITYGPTSRSPVNLSKLSDDELVRLQLHKNDWHVRQARRLLQERAAAGKLGVETHAALRQMLAEHPDVTRKLRALWTLAVTGGLDEQQIMKLLASPHEHVRGWAIQLEVEDRTVSAETLVRLTELAKSDPSPVVRLYLASALQRLPLEQRGPIAEALVARGEDAGDPNLPLMIWYGIEPLAQTKPEQATALLSNAKLPLVRQYISRRIAGSSANLTPLVDALRQSKDAEFQQDVLRGMHESLEGRRDVSMPNGWTTVFPKLAASPDAAVREKAMVLAVIFGDRQAIASLKKMVLDNSADEALRHTALEALIQQRDAQLLPLLQMLLGDPSLRGQAARGLANYDDKSTPEVLLRRYGEFTAAEKSDVVNTLSSRPVYALALLQAVERGEVTAGDLSTFHVRQLLSFDRREINELLEKVWGTFRPTAGEKTALVAEYKSQLTSEFLKKADLSQGRLVYSRTCAACHRLFDDGGQIGPELTGAQRANLDYVLENLLDPNALIGRDYQMTIIVTENGRVVTGIIKQETDKTLTVQTTNERIVIPKAEIEERRRSPLSMMPEGILAKLTIEEIRDMIVYLGGTGQTPLPKETSSK